MIVEDARQDSRFASLAVTADVNIGSYIGMPIYLSNGTIYGTLCAIDPEPWHFEAHDVEQLVILARLLGFVIEQEQRLVAARRAAR